MSTRASLGALALLIIAVAVGQLVTAWQRAKHVRSRSDVVRDRWRENMTTAYRPELPVEHAYRPLTPREIMRAQGFKNFPLPMGATPRGIREMGNAIATGSNAKAPPARKS